MAKTTILEVYKDKKGMYRFRLLAKNGEPVVASEAYAKKATAMANAKKLKDWIVSALLVDKDMKAEVAKKTTASVSKKMATKKKASAKKVVEATV